MCVVCLQGGFLQRVKKVLSPETSGGFAECKKLKKQVNIKHQRARDSFALPSSVCTCDLVSARSEPMTGTLDAESLVAITKDSGLAYPQLPRGIGSSCGLVRNLNAKFLASLQR